MHMHTPDTYRSSKSHPHSKDGSSSSKDTNVLGVDTVSEGVPYFSQLAPSRGEYSNHDESSHTWCSAGVQ